MGRNEGLTATVRRVILRSPLSPQIPLLENSNGEEAKDSVGARLASGGVLCYSSIRGVSFLIPMRQGFLNFAITARRRGNVEKGANPPNLRPQLVLSPWCRTEQRVRSVWGDSGWMSYFRHVYLRLEAVLEEIYGVTSLTTATWHFGLAAQHHPTASQYGRALRCCAGFPRAPCRRAAQSHAGG